MMRNQLIIGLFSLCCGLQTAWADDKIDVVRQVYESFRSGDNDGWINYLGTPELKESLKQREDYLTWFDGVHQGEQSACVAETYHVAYPGNDVADFENGLQVSYETKKDAVIATLASELGINQVLFHLKGDQGAYKIHNITHYHEGGQTSSFQESVKSACKVGVHS